MSNANSNSDINRLNNYIKSLEDLIDIKLSKLSTLLLNLSNDDNKFNRNEDELENFKNFEIDFNELMDKLSYSINDLVTQNNLNNDEDDKLVNKHKSILKDFNHEFKRLKGNIEHHFNSVNLLGNVRKEIDAYKASHQTDTDLLLAERGRIDHSHSMLDSTLSQAFETRSEFLSQGVNLRNIGVRLSTTLSTIPGINSLIGLISARRRRDSIILGVLIGICIIIILTYTTS